MKQADYSHIGKNLHIYRQAKKLTQDRLAKEAGISRTAYRNIETSASMPTVNTLINICNALGVQFQDVLKPARELRKIKWN